MYTVKYAVSVLSSMWEVTRTTQNEARKLNTACAAYKVTAGRDGSTGCEEEQSGRSRKGGCAGDHFQTGWPVYYSKSTEEGMCGKSDSSRSSELNAIS